MSTVTRSLLRGVELLLLVVGGAMVVWCWVVLLQLFYTQHMPVPEPAPVAVQETSGAESQTQ